MLMKMAEISQNAITEGNVRDISYDYMTTALSLVEKEQNSEEVRTELQTRGKEFKTYYEQFQGLYASLKYYKINNEPITITELTADETEQDTGKRYGIINGHTRFAIAQQLKWSEIDVNIKSNVERDKIKELALQANLAKTDMVTAEKAMQAYKLSRTPQKDEHGYPVKYSTDTKKHKKGDIKLLTNAMIGEKMGIKEARVRQLLKIYDRMNPASAKTENIIETTKPEKAEVDYYTIKDNRLVETAEVTERITSVSKTLNELDFQNIDTDKALQVFDSANELIESYKFLKQVLQQNETIKKAISQRTAEKARNERMRRAKIAEERAESESVEKEVIEKNKKAKAKPKAEGTKKPKAVTDKKAKAKE